MDERTIPAGFRQVDKAKFFAAIGPLNVHPSPEPGITAWVTSAAWPASRIVVGYSWPGYLREGPKVWALANSI